MRKNEKQWDRARMAEKNQKDQYNKRKSKTITNNETKVKSRGKTRRDKTN